MTKNSVLGIVLTYLDYVDGFEVDSINDSTEASQAATIVEHMYYSVVNRFTWLQSQTSLDSLVASDDPAKPVVMYLKESVKRLQYSNVRYNISDDGGVQWKLITYLEPQEFLNHVNANTSRHDNVQEINIHNSTVLVRTDKHPDYFTSFDDNMLVFDSYKADVDETLMEEKTQVITEGSQVFLREDSFIIPLPAHLQAGFMDVALNECMISLRGIQNPEVARRANHFWATIQHEERRVGGLSKRTIRYGRR